jgi:benzoyl-CoA reductase subunit B
MNYYEGQVIKLQERMKKLETNPEPGRLKSNRLKYEMEIEETKKQAEAWEKGVPFSEGGGLMASSITSVMGFAVGGGVGPAQQTKNPEKYIEIARNIGLPIDNACDMTMMPFAMMVSGDLAMEDMNVSDQHACTCMNLRGIYVAHNSKTKTYFIDIPTEQDEAGLKYVKAQLEEFIRWVEKNFPGMKYNEEKLIERQEYQEQIEKLTFETYELRKHNPCPIGGLDIIGGGAAPTKKGVEYMKARRDEVAERVAKGIGAVPNQKLRMMWTVTRPFFMDPYKVLAKWGVVVPVYYSGPILGWAPLPRPEFFSRKLSPLEKVAAHALSDQWGHTGKRWSDGMIWVARDQKIDAIINFNMVGCTATLGLRKVVEERAEKELGIPMLQLEGKMWDRDYADENTLSSKMGEFVQMCLSNKGLA